MNKLTTLFAIAAVAICSIASAAHAAPVRFAQEYDGPAVASVAYMNGFVAAVAPVTTTAQPVVCDGDGTSGYRVQVVYARTSAVADRYSEYLNSFKFWAQDTDSVFSRSARETGGDRHVRFVTDAACFPAVANVALSATGLDSFNNMVSELQALGYNRADRKYLVFADSNAICGISDIQFDDSAAQTNLNNQGPHYARADAQCWSTTVAAHELMHTLGGVQMTAPHSSIDWHCTDQNDLMCRPTNGTPVTQTCANDGQLHFDCNHDDYFSTNPPAGSYLASHWNVANSRFLIGQAATTTTATTTVAAASVTIDALQTGKLSKNVFTATSTFKAGDTVAVRAHAVDSTGKALKGATVTVKVVKPDGSVQCTLTGTTDASGNVTGSCNTSRSATPGTWNANLNAISLSGYTSNMTGSTKNAAFKLQ